MNHRSEQLQNGACRTYLATVFRQIEPSSRVADRLLSWLVPTNPVRQTRSIVGDSRQERRIHFRKPWQAEKVDSGHYGNSVLMLRPTSAVKHREFDPVEIKSISSRPYDGADACAFDINLGQGIFDIGEITMPPSAGLLVDRKVQPAFVDEPIRSFQGGAR